MKKVFTLFVIISLTHSVFAQSPQKMSYQAVVRNTSGVLMDNQAVGMKISILQGSATGTAVYVETHTTTTNANGLATIEIGGGTPVTGTFAGIDWSNGTYFIKTETDPTGGTNYSITGTNQILSVPYALYAKTAETAATKEYVDMLAESIKGVLGGSKVIDRDGNIYNTVAIGTQVWMAENLRTTKFSDGSSIPKVIVDGDWHGLTTGAYCWYNNDSATYEVPYGKLYNWYAIYNTKICPVGWHVPDVNGWMVLLNYLGGARVAGGKLKETGTTHWDRTSSYVTNETGFTALPGGYRTSSFSDIRRMGVWWSPTLLKTGIQIFRMESGSPEVFIDEGPKNSGYSIRCVKD